MNVLLTLASASAHLSGVQRHVLNVAHCLLTRDEIAEVHCAVAPWQNEFVPESLLRNPRFRLHCAAIGSSALSRNWWYYSELPKLSRAIKADIVHLGYPVPVQRRAMKKPVLVTLHDLYPYDLPHNFGFPRVIVNRFLLRQCLERVDMVACVSQATRRRFAHYFPRYPDAKTAVIPNCVGKIGEISLQAAAWSASLSPFLLCVAQHRKNKNILLLIHAFHDLLQAKRISWKMRLVIVGIEGPETASLHNMIRSFGLQNRIILRSGLSEEHLWALYRRCEALVAPSTLEGFGLPVAEGLLAGCRVICSDIEAFREVGSTCCTYVDLSYLARKNLAAAIVAALRSPVARPQALPQYSAETIAAHYIDVYHRLSYATALSRGTSLSGKGVLHGC